MLQDRNDTERRIFTATRRLFNEKGYEGMTLREVAKAVGIEAPSLYNYTPSKQALVQRMMLNATEMHGIRVEQALAVAPPDPTSRLRAAVTAHIHYYCEDEAMVALTGSVHAIESPYREELVAAMKTYEDTFKKLVTDGIEAGVFRPVDVPITAYAILGLGSAVLRWFKLDGRLSADAVAEEYADLAVRMVTSPA